MSVKSEFISGPLGRLATLTISPEDTERARVIMSHGFSANASMVEHAKLFMQSAEFFKNNNIGSTLFDFSGNGQSDGYFHETSPNLRILDLENVLLHTRKNFHGPTFLIGLSMGGAISVFVAEKYQNQLSGMITWSCVPSFNPSSPSTHWFPKVPVITNVESIGHIFLKDMPEKDISETYQKLQLPKLQIQGDKDFDYFQSEFESFFHKSPEPKKHIVIPGADHVFTNTAHRKEAIQLTLAWIEEILSS